MLAYLDHAATTPPRPQALAAMWPWFTERFGNPSGAHQVSRAARAAVDDARDIVAAVLGVPAGGVVFTSGGTEADNLAVLGSVAARPGPVVVSAIEHEAVRRSAEASGQPVRVVPVDRSGVIDLVALEAALDSSVSVVSVMLVNNEIGTVQPLADVAALVRRRARHAVFHTDAVQATSLDIASLAAEADLISLSAHKFGGPQGVGVLAGRPGAAYRRVQHGGGQEQERRAGTHNVAGIAGLAAALDATQQAIDVEGPELARLKDRLARQVLAIPGVSRTTDAPTASTHLHVLVDGVESEALLLLLDQEGVAASAGSACASGAIEASPVLLAMGIPEQQALGSLRLTLGHTSTADEIDGAAKVIAGAVARLREDG